MIQKILEKLGIASLNKMQLAAIDAAKKSADLILLSPTGSGKTLAFLLPVLATLKPETTGVQALILVPSRELALQIEQVFKQMQTGLKVSCFYGGHASRTERNSLAHPPAVLVGTPGRIAYHVRHETFDTDSIHFLVLDEFDKSLEFGFKEDMSFIITRLKKLQKRFLTSATNMPEIPAFTGIRKPVQLDFLDKRSPTTTGLASKYIRAGDNDKLLGLRALLQNLNLQVKYFNVCLEYLFRV
jgi:ATP-independent RNA helicase DbpA